MHKLLNYTHPDEHGWLFMVTLMRSLTLKRDERKRNNYHGAIWSTRGLGMEIFTLSSVLLFFPGLEIMSLFMDASMCCQTLSALAGAADHHPALGFN